jgi:hypothetical protein
MTFKGPKNAAPSTRHTTEGARLLAFEHSFGPSAARAAESVAQGKDPSYCSVTATPLALAAESLAGLTLQALGGGLLRAAQRNRPLVRTCRRGLSGGRRRFRGIAPAGTRRLPIDADARAHRPRRRLTESRAARQQGQDSYDRKDSADFHCNVSSFNRVRRPARRMTASEDQLVLETHVSGEN